MSDLINIGCSSDTDDKLAQLKELGVFAEKIDGYRFGVSLALAQGAEPTDLVNRKNLYNVGSLDPDQVLKRSVEALMPERLSQTTPYRLIEQLADWGVKELYSQAVEGKIDFVEILKQIEEKRS